MYPGRLFRAPPESRFAGIIATVLVHAALFSAWQASRHVRLPDHGEPSFVQWVRLPQRLPTASVQSHIENKARRESIVDGVAAVPLTAVPTRPERADRVPDHIGEPAVEASPSPAGDSLDAALPPVVSTVPSPSDGARLILERAKRDARAIDRALRKESNPYIIAPPDSPQIRMSKKIKEAAALAPNRLWEAPKMIELVNDSGDGARRTRVVTAAGIYCITERSPATSIDLIEKHGKLRITNCGHEHEQPANAQEWRTARD